MRNRRFLGQMTFQEFREGLRAIFMEDDIFVSAQSNSKSFRQVFQDIIHFRFVKDFFKEEEPSKGSTSIFEDIRYIVTFEFITDLKNWLKTPLTQDVFIKRGKSFRKWFYDLMETVFFVLVMVIIIRFFIGEIRWIPSGSMHPTLLEGDRIFVERYSRFFTSPRRGDIMVFYPPSTELSRMPIPLFSRLTGIGCKDIAYIKRVIGLPGEKVEIKFETDGSAFVYINDKKMNEPYIQSIYEYPRCPLTLSPEIVSDNRIMKCGPFYLKDDEYFMMGDNRGNSQDSRYWGTLKRDRFIGRAVSIFWPPHRGQILP